MTCSDYQDLFELYSLGALEPAEAETLREHLEGGCTDCAESLKLALHQTALLSATVPQVEPPARLRKRIAATFLLAPEPKRAWSFLPWATAAAAISCLVIGIAWEVRNQNNEQVRLAAVSDETRRMSAMLQIVQAPGTKQVMFGGTGSPQGSLFIHAKLGVAMAVGNLPAAPAGWKYESWVVLKQGDPRPVESFPELPGSRAVTVVPGPVNVSEWTAVAVSMELVGTEPTKPSKLVFSAPV